MGPASSKEFLDIQANYRVKIHSENRRWYDNNIQSVKFNATMKSQFSCCPLIWMFSSWKLNHHILILTGFDYQSPRIIESLLSIRQQRTKINNHVSCYSEIIYEVPQGSILGPLLFNIYVCDIVFDIIECDIASYADYNTPYNFDFNLDNVISNLEKSSNSLLHWFTENIWKPPPINVIS